MGGIYIRNQTSRHNSVTFADGTFKIKANVSDTLLITSITYKPQQLIVSETSYNEATLAITLEPLINELDEIEIADKLSKEERAQLNKVTDDLKNDLTWEKMEFDYEFTPDKFSSIVGNTAANAYNNGQQQNDGVKLQLIIPAVIKFLRGKDKEVKPTLPREVVRHYLKEKFTKTDLFAYFDIPVSSAEDFLYYLVEQGIPDHYLDANHELELTQLISEKALEYNARVKK